MQNFCYKPRAGCSILGISTLDCVHALCVCICLPARMLYYLFFFFYMDYIGASLVTLGAYGHTTLNAPVLVRSPKLSSVGPAQYLDG